MPENLRRAADRVLVVEDDAAVCEVLQVQLTRRGVHSLWTTTAAAAILGPDRKTLYRKLER